MGLPPNPWLPSSGQPFWLFLHRLSKQALNLFLQNGLVLERTVKMYSIYLCKKSPPTESAPLAFGIPLSQVIANDRAFKRRQDALKESRRDCLDLEASILRFRAEKRQFFNGNKPSASSSPPANSVAPAPGSDSQSKPMSPTFLDNSGRRRRVSQWRPAH